MYQSLAGEDVYSMSLLGNKCDLSEKRQVSRETTQNYANSLDMNHFEVSAKSGQDIHEAFLKITQ